MFLAAGRPAAEPLDSARGRQAKPANAPTFKVDPIWPHEMPNHWIMGAVTGVFVDAKQHVWVTHLPETLTEEELYEEPWNVVTPPAPVAAAAVRLRRPPQRKARADRHLLQGRAAGARIRSAGQAGAGLGPGLATTT